MGGKEREEERRRSRRKERRGEEGGREGRRKLTVNRGKCRFLFTCTCTVTDLMCLHIPTSVCT